MVRLALAFLFSCLVATAQAASPIESLTAIGSGGSTYPLPDPALTVEHLWITQGASGDFKITPTQLGYVLQKTTAPLNPMTYQQWLDTSGSPVLLKRWLGSQWVTERSLNLSLQTSTDVTGLTNAHIFVGNASNVSTDVAVSGDVTTTNAGVFTIANNAITTVKIANDAIQTAKIADGQVTAAKISGRAVFGATGTTTPGNVVVWSSATGDGITDPAGPIGVLVGGTGKTTMTNHGVLLGQGTAAVVAVAPGTSGYPLLSTGASADPAFGQLDLAGAGVTGILPQGNFTLTPTFTSLSVGSISTSGNVQVGGAQTITDNLGVTGNIGVTGDLAVSGETALTGDVSFSGALTRDASFYLTLSSSNPLINFNPSTYLLFDRSLNRFSLTIGASSAVFSSAGNLTIPGCLNYNGGTLGVCL